MCMYIRVYACEDEARRLALRTTCVHIHVLDIRIIVWATLAELTRIS